jgi:hypothetical protein
MFSLHETLLETLVSTIQTLQRLRPEFGAQAKQEIGQASVGKQLRQGELSVYMSRMACNIQKRAFEKRGYFRMVTLNRKLPLAEPIIVPVKWAPLAMGCQLM